LPIHRLFSKSPDKSGNYIIFENTDCIFRDKLKPGRLRRVGAFFSTPEGTGVVAVEAAAIQLLFSD
jgi:hypothetical protein